MGAVATAPSYFGAGIKIYDTNSGAGGAIGAFIDDYVINPSPSAEFNVAEAIPSNWSVVIDDINPANNGLYDPSGSLVDSNYFWGKYSTKTNATKTWQIQNFLTGSIAESLKTASARSAKEIQNNVSTLINQPTGLYRTFIDETGSSSYFWVTRYGATALWDDTVYDLEDTAILSYSVTGGYWDTANYDYEVDVISETGTKVASQSLSAASGSKSFPITEALYNPGSIYYGVVNAVNKSTSEDTYMAYDIMTINDEISLQGYVMNATDGSPVSGALVTVTQTDGTRVSTTSGTTGIYNVTGILDNYQLWFNTSATGYWADNHTFMPYTIKGYNVNISMIPETIAVSGAALIGRTYEKPYFNAVPGATLLATNTTHALSNTTTSNIAGGYFFDGLPASELMSDYGSLSGYVPDQYPYRINTSALGSYVIQDVNFSTSYNLGLTFRDATTHALILSSVTIEYSGAETGTTTTTIGTANISSSYGILTVIVSAENYYGATDSYLMDTDRTDTIYLTSVEDNTASQQSYPLYISFYFMEGFGTPIPDVDVTVVPYSTSTGSFEYIASLMGIPLNAAPMENQTMYQTSGTDGKASFYMLPTTQYNISYSKAGYTFSPPFIYTSFTNQQDMYIYAEGTMFFENGEDELSAVSLRISTPRINETHAYVNVTYLDKTGTTTGGLITIIKQNMTPYAADSVLATFPVTSSSFTNSTIVHTSEVYGTASATIYSTQFGTIERTSDIYIKGTAVKFFGFGPEIALLFALGIMMMTVQLATALTAGQIVFVSALEGWIFYSIGWFDSLVARGVPEVTLVLALTIMTVAGIFLNFSHRKRKEKY